MKISIHQYLTLIVTEFVNTLAEEKKSAKYDEFFASDDFFCRLFFYWQLLLPTINFYRQILLPTFFFQTRTFSIF